MDWAQIVELSSTRKAGTAAPIKNLRRINEFVILNLIRFEWKQCKQQASTDETIQTMKEL